MQAFITELFEKFSSHWEDCIKYILKEAEKGSNRMRTLVPPPPDTGTDISGP